MNPRDFLLKRSTGFTYGELCWLVTVALDLYRKREHERWDGISPRLGPAVPTRTAPFPRR